MSEARAPLTSRTSPPNRGCYLSNGHETNVCQSHTPSPFHATHTGRLGTWEEASMEGLRNACGDDHATAPGATSHGRAHMAAPPALAIQRVGIMHSLDARACVLCCVNAAAAPCSGRGLLPPSSPEQRG